MFRKALVSPKEFVFVFDTVLFSAWWVIVMYAFVRIVVWSGAKNLKEVLSPFASGNIKKFIGRLVNLFMSVV